MKYHPINPALFVQNRKRFSQLLKPNSLAVFNSNDIPPKSADGTRAFIQHSDIFYLSGADQEETILVLFPDAKMPEHKEILFVRKTNELIAIWEGEKLTQEKATEISGIATVYWLEEFETIFNALMAEADHVYLTTNEHLRADITVQTRDDRFIKWCQGKYPLHRYERSAPIMHRLRAIKSQIEIDQLQEACNITEKAFRRLLSFIKPGVWEYEIEAEIWHEFIRNRSKGMAYEPIIASGLSACVLHYIENNKPCKDGDLVLMDFGAEYANYNADLTRTIPVNGRFTPRQKAVYNAVLRVHRAASEMLTPGNTIDQYHKEVGLIMEKELLGLGLIDTTDIKNQDPKWPAFKKYFMHGTSHHLGLDVHDYGSKFHPFEKGMVFTIEPGIYIREESIGIRIENDVVITQNGIFDLMRNIPIEADEIEDLMNR